MPKSYPSDLTDLEWQIIEPLVPRPQTKKGGRPREVNIRRVLDAIFYVLKGGIPWRMLPKDLPPTGTVYYYFRLWKNNGSIEKIHDKLRAITRVQADKKPWATAGIVDSQSVKATEEANKGKGYDAGKKTKGRKRHIVVDTLGLLIVAIVHAASIQDRVGARHAIRKAKMKYEELVKLWADGGYAGTLIAWAKETWNIDLEI